jgi:hypothetical protein
MFTRFAGTRFVWFSCAWTADAVELASSYQTIGKGLTRVMNRYCRLP